MKADRLRIALLMHSLNPRGGVVHTLELADALVAQGHDVTVMAAAAAGQTLFRATRARLSIAPLLAGPSGLVNTVRHRIDAMTDHLRTWNALADLDVFHSQDSITANTLANLTEEGRVGGYVRTVHHLDAFDEPPLTAWQARGVTTASLLLCVSDLWQGVLRRDWAREARRVHNGVNLQRYTPVVTDEQAAMDHEALCALGVQPAGPVWLAVGGVEARKNTVALLQAFTRVRRLVPQAQLVIAGGASLLQHGAAVLAFQTLRHEAGLAPGQPDADRLVCTGPVSDAVLAALYRRARALVMPSLQEGFGLVALEAMACGTPALVSRRAPFTEHFREGEVFWVDPFDVDDIARGLVQSLDPDHHSALAHRARDVCQRFSWAASATRHIDLYQHHLACHA